MKRRLNPCEILPLSHIMYQVIICILLDLYYDTSAAHTGADSQHSDLRVLREFGWISGILCAR